MIDSNKKERIRKFIGDKQTSNAVYEILRESFLKKKSGADVHILASATLAVYALDEGWKELEKQLDDKQDDSKPLAQIGL